MSVAAVQNEIRLARGVDNTITVAEARAIVAAAKRNIKADEIAEIQGLLTAVNNREVTLEEGAQPILADAVRPGAHEETVGSVLKSTMLAPASPFTRAATWLMEKATGGWKALAGIAAALLYLLAALAVLVSAIVTFPVGAIRGAVIANRD